ncbi:MAG: hypothetical protein OEV44_08865 [Spirochaetota bacterium]|nr:hypothetical protein [Spirochaetota bacterium]
MKFNEIVDKVKGLAYQEKEELKLLLDKYLVEERREEIETSYRETQKEYKESKLIFSSDIDKLKEHIDR